MENIRYKMKKVMKLMNRKYGDFLGMLINFQSAFFNDGIKNYWVVMFVI
jgi:hypothetical protein